MSPAEIVGRLENAINRANGAVSRAVKLHKVWQVLQETENRQSIADSAAGAVIGIFETSIIRETILIIVRLLDSPGRDSASTSDRISFRVMKQLSEISGVNELLAARSQKKTVMCALNRFRLRLDELGSEEPNRLRLLRNFRDENLAHELVLEKVGERPLYRHVGEMLGEIKDLTNQASLAVAGSITAWTALEGDVERQAREFLDTLARGIAQKRSEIDQSYVELWGSLDK